MVATLILHCSRVLNWVSYENWYSVIIDSSQINDKYADLSARLARVSKTDYVQCVQWSENEVER